MLKRFLYTALILVSITVSPSYAKILRVGYNGVARTGVDYSDITSAQTAASVGDTLQIYGQQNGGISKRLVIQGFGYNLDVHPNLQANGGKTPSLVTLTCNVGSDSSIIEGVSGGYIYLYSSKVIIRRCNSIIYLFNNTNSINDIKVISSVVQTVTMYYSNGFPCSNFQMFNCIINGGISFYQSGSSGSIINCVSSNPAIYGSFLNLSNSSFLVKNSILQYSPSDVNTVWINNVFIDAQPSTLPQGSNNRWGQTWANVFNRLGGTTDAAGYYSDASFDENYYILKPGSLAINGGVDFSNNQTDCGIYGGELATRYSLSGIPPIPAIYKLTAPSNAATTNPYNVTVSIRSNN